MISFKPVNPCNPLRIVQSLNVMLQPAGVLGALFQTPVCCIGFLAVFIRRTSKI